MKIFFSTFIIITNSFICSDIFKTENRLSSLVMKSQNTKISEKSSLKKFPEEEIINTNNFLTIIKNNTLSLKKTEEELEEIEKKYYEAVSDGDSIFNINKDNKEEFIW